MRYVITIMRYVITIMSFVFTFAVDIPLSNSQSHKNEPVGGPIRFVPDAKTVAIKFWITSAQKEIPRVREAWERRAGDIRKLFWNADMDYPPEEVLLRVLKDNNVLELWVRPVHGRMFELLKTYHICDRSGKLGPKRIQGDQQVPEGFYSVTKFDPESPFHLSMLINYPNPSDYIRGDQKAEKTHIHGGCVTIGCIPITDRRMEELYPICLDSKWKYGNWLQVHIFPRYMNKEGMASLEEEFEKKPKLLFFWKELHAGYKYFEEARIPPEFDIKEEDGTYLLRYPLGK